MHTNKLNFYTHEWKKINHFPGLINTTQKTWMIFFENNKIVKDFIVFLKKKNQKIILIKKKNSVLEKIEKDTFYLDPAQENSYIELSKKIQHLNNENINVLYFWNYHSHSCHIDFQYEKNSIFDDSFLCLYFLCKLLFVSLKSVNFSLINTGLAKINKSDNIDLFKATLIGALRTLHYEYPNFKSIIIDSTKQSTLDFEKAFSIVSNEKLFTDFKFFAIRKSVLYKQKLSIASIKPNNNDKTIKNGDHILIIGGLGGIGLSIAKIISEKFKVNYLLTYKKNIKSKKEKKFQEEHINSIKKNGSKIVTCKVDVNNKDSVSNLLKVFNHNNKIDHIFFTAGELPIESKIKTREKLISKVLVKTHGVYNVLKEFKHVNIKSFISISSLSSVVGDPGRIDYSSSNSSLDILSNLYFPNISKILTINLPGCKNIGMDLHVSDSESFNSHLSIQENYINFEDIKSCLISIINQDKYNQLIISKVSPKLIKKTLIKNKENYKKDEYLLNEESVIEKIFEDNSSKINSKENLDFFSNGGSSLSSLQLISDIYKQLHISISLSEFYENRSLYSLKKLINLKKKIMNKSLTGEI